MSCVYLEVYVAKALIFFAFAAIAIVIFAAGVFRSKRSWQLGGLAVAILELILLLKSQP